MDIITQKRNYLPIDLETKYHCCSRRIDSKWPIRKIISFYHVKRASLYRWLKLFNGTKDSLNCKSHKPIKEHPRKIKEEITKRVLNLHRRNPDQSFIEIWVRLYCEGITISPSSVLRIFKKSGDFKPYKPSIKKHDKVYHTPAMVHEKWQIDVKFVPSECKSIGLEGRYYQYTILDEASRKRALYFTNEHSMYETVRAIEYAIDMFGCSPKELQSDNGLEFSDRAKRNKEGKYGRTYDNYLERYLKEHNISHHFIRPRTPQHNGKVERSHRIDQDKFYRILKFYNLSDLRKQGSNWNKKYNNTPKIVLGFKSPNQIEVEKLNQLLHSTGEIRCFKRLTSFDT